MTATPRTRRSLPVLGAAALALAACGTEGTTSSTTTSSTSAARPASTSAATAPSAAPATPSSVPPAGTSATSVTAPATSGTATSSAAATSSPAARAATRTPATQPATKRLPVYLVGPDGDGRTERGAAAPRLRLFREYLPAPPGAASGSAQDVAATRAVSLAMSGGPAPYRSVWGERSVASVTRTAAGITVTLDDGQVPATDAAAARLAVAQVVWTATAGYGANVPVRFVVPGSSTVIGSLPTSASYSRATGEDQGEVLAGLWIDSPGIGQRVPAGPVRATGQASVWEASFTWRLLRGSEQVGTGIGTASVGAPARGSWLVDLGSLRAGSYTLVVEAQSPADDQGAMARATHPFTVG